MYDKQIAKEQARFGKQTAGELIGTDRDDTCQIGKPISYGKNLTIDLQVSPVRVKGKRMCMVEAWLMHEYTHDAASSINSVSVGPFPVSTPMKELVPTAYAMVPMLKARHHVLPRFSSQMLEQLRKYKPAASLVEHIDEDVATAHRKLMK